MSDEIEVTMDCDKCQEFQYNRGRTDAIDEFMRLLSNKGYYDVFESEFTISHYDLLMIEKQVKEQSK